MSIYVFPALTMCVTGVIIGIALGYGAILFEDFILVPVGLIAFVIGIYIGVKGGIFS